MYKTEITFLKNEYTQDSGNETSKNENQMKDTYLKKLSEIELNTFFANVKYCQDFFF